MRTEPELLNERLDRLALVLDEIMPNCANLVRDALDLLKEQEAIVQCKDCKHGRRMKTEDGIEVYCENNRIERIFCEQDWFCADGRRRDE